ncbi:MAG: LamG domain-containing protein, partial [Planctomycetes bacterium]|nr:LamG domain-containing protein [Planctomycetota bacterium]
MCNKLLCLLMLVFVIGGVAIVKADPNLVAWYKFDETSGANVTDSSGNGFHTSINGTVSYGWDSDGAVNGCLNNHFANRNVYIPVPMGVFSAMDKQATFTFWAQLTELSSSGLYTGGWFTGTDPNSDKLAWARAYQFDDYTRFSAVYNLGTTSQDEWWSAYYPDTEGVNEWHHFAMVFDEIAETKKLYFDGQLITSASRDIEEGDSIADMNAFNIFHATSTGAGYWDSFHGKMDDFRIYDKALSAQEVAMFSGGYFEVAKTPYPADGASIELGSPDALTMEWVAGLFAASHNVYLGTNFNDVNDANTLSAEFMGNRVAAAYTPSFPSDGTYYWRIDEVNDVNVWKGDVWSFEVEITADPNLVAW